MTLEDETNLHSGNVDSPNSQSTSATSLSCHLHRVSGCRTRGAVGSVIFWIFWHSTRLCTGTTSARFEAFTAALLKIWVFWYVTLCRWAGRCGCFQQWLCLHFRNVGGCLPNDTSSYSRALESSTLLSFYRFEPQFRDLLYMVVILCVL